MSKGDPKASAIPYFQYASEVEEAATQASYYMNVALDETDEDMKQIAIAEMTLALVRLDALMVDPVYPPVEFLVEWLRSDDELPF